MRDTYSSILLCVAFVLAVADINAQNIKEEMGKRFRQEIIDINKLPDQSSIIQYHNIPKLFSSQYNEVLTVSPYTKLPTKSDGLILNYYPANNIINIVLTVTNALPINTRPAGSIHFESMGGRMQIISTSGRSIVPAGGGAPIRKKHNRNSNLLDILEH